MRYGYVFMILSAYLTWHTHAFGLYGAYERMYFWYAYQADVIKNGKATWIATGCKPAPCTFENFLKFISADPNYKVPALPGLKSEGRRATDRTVLPLDETARILDRAGVTGQYHGDKIAGAAVSDIPAIFEKVARPLHGVTTEANALHVRNAQEAMERVHFRRLSANINAFKEHMDKTFGKDSLKTVLVDVPGGLNGEQHDRPKAKETQDSIRLRPGREEWSFKKEFHEGFLKRPEVGSQLSTENADHWRNIEGAKRSLTLIKQGYLEC